MKERAQSCVARQGDAAPSPFEEIEIVEEDDRFVAVVQGVKFAPEIGCKVIAEAVTGVKMIGTFPKCGEEVLSKPLDSMGEVGRNIASFIPQSFHFCTSKLAEESNEAVEYYSHLK